MQPKKCLPSIKNVSYTVDITAKCAIFPETVRFSSEKRYNTTWVARHLLLYHSLLYHPLFVRTLTLTSHLAFVLRE